MNDLMFTHGDSGAASTRVGGKSKASQASTAQSRAGASAAGGDKATPSTSSRTHGDHDDDGAADVSESSESESDDEPPLPPHVIVTSEMLAESEEKNAKSLQQIVDDRVVALRETDKLDPSEVVVVVTPEMQHTAKKYAKGKHTGRYKRRGEGQTWKQLEQDETDYLIQDQLESLIKEEVWRLRLEAWRLREDEALKAELAARDAAGRCSGQFGVQELCEAALDGALKNWDEKPPSLDIFQPKAKSVPLATYLRTDVQIHTVPEGDHEDPVLLLFDVMNESHKQKPVYAHIDKTRKLGPTALHGTSGAGKTRSAIEYLSHNFGLYFSANIDKRNVGSKDFSVLLQYLTKTLPPVLDSVGNGQQKSRSSRNQVIVATWVDTLVYVRQAVFERVQKQLKRALSPYEWMLLQLYPTEFLGNDVFLTLMNACLANEAVRISSPAALRRTGDETIRGVCFVDDTQELFNALPGRFLSKNGYESRSAFAVFLKAFAGMGHAQIAGFPVFSGTGLSIDALDDALHEEVHGSGSPGKLCRNTYKLVFSLCSPT